MKLKSNLYAPILFGVVMLFTGLTGLIVSVAQKFEMDLFLSSTIIQLIVYLLPLAFYCKVRGYDIVSTMNFRYVSPSKIPFLVNMALIFFVGSTLLRYFGLFFFDSAMVVTPSAVNIPVESTNGFLTIFCGIVLPAVFEELLFRGVLLEEYRSYGSYWSVAISTVMFAMLHLSLENFIYYLFMGVVFGIIALASDSVIPGILLHILVNLSHEYVRPSAVEYLRQAGKSPLLPYLLLGVFILLFVFMFSGLENIYQGKVYSELLQSRKELLRKEVEKARAIHNEETEESAGKKFLIVFREVFLTPTFLGCVVIFIGLVSQVFKEVSL